MYECLTDFAAAAAAALLFFVLLLSTISAISDGRVGFTQFDLITAFNSTTHQRDATISDRRGYPRAKLIRTLADEVHRSASDLQLRQFRRLRFALVMLHARIMVYFSSSSSSSSLSSSSSFSSTVHAEHALDGLLRALVSLLRRRTIHHHCVFALGKDLSSGGGGGGRIEIREPGVDLPFLKWMIGACTHIYCDGLSDSSNAYTIVQHMIHDMVCMAAGMYFGCVWCCIVLCIVACIVSRFVYCIGLSTYFLHSSSFYFQRKIPETRCTHTIGIIQVL